MSYQVQFSAHAVEILNGIGDRRIRLHILQRAARLSEEPDKQGRPLNGELSGYRSVRAAGQRYRIIYRIDRGRIQVVVIAAALRRDGDRRDFYALAQRLVRLGLTLPLEEGEGL